MILSTRPSIAVGKPICSGSAGITVPTPCARGSDRKLRSSGPRMLSASMAAAVRWRSMTCSTLLDIPGRRIETKVIGAFWKARREEGPFGWIGGTIGPLLTAMACLAL